MYQYCLEKICVDHSWFKGYLKIWYLVSLCVIFWFSFLFIEQFTDFPLRLTVLFLVKGSLPKLALPDGWIALNHRSGGIVYLHKPMRVCTWSRPYHIGGGSVRVLWFITINFIMSLLLSLFLSLSSSSSSLLSFSQLHWSKTLEFFIYYYVKKIKPFSSFRRYIKNSVIDGYNSIIDS